MNVLIVERFTHHDFRRANKSYQNTFYRCTQCKKECGPYNYNSTMTCPDNIYFMCPTDYPERVIVGIADIEWIKMKTKRMVRKLLRDAKVLERQYNTKIDVPWYFFSNHNTNHHHSAAVDEMIEKKQLESYFANGIECLRLI